MTVSLRRAPTSVRRGYFLIYAPSLVVGEVPVQAVHVVERHHVDVGFHLVNGEEVAAHVEVDAAVGEARLVGDDRGRQQGRAAAGHDGLAQRLQTVEDAGLGIAAYLDAVAGDAQRVGFRTAVVGRQLQQDVAPGLAAGFGAVGLARGGLQVSGQVAGVAPHGLIAFGIDYSDFFAQLERAVGAYVHFAGQGYHAVVGYGRRVHAGRQTSGHDGRGGASQ